MLIKFRLVSRKLFNNFVWKRNVTLKKLYLFINKEKRINIECRTVKIFSGVSKMHVLDIKLREMLQLPS